MTGVQTCALPISGLRDKVQATLDEMAKDGTIDKIAEKYADLGVPGSLCIGK